MEIKIYSVPSTKNFMYILSNKIKISYGCLSSITDSCLITSIYHETGHRKNLFKILLLSILFTIFISVLLILLPFVFYPILLFFSYLVYCWIARIGEFWADRYAYSIVSKSDMLEFYYSLNHDCNSLFYLFRYHPSIKRRIKKLD